MKLCERRDYLLLDSGELLRVGAGKTYLSVLIGSLAAVHQLEESFTGLNQLANRVPVSERSANVVSLPTLVGHVRVGDEKRARDTLGLMGDVQETPFRILPDRVKLAFHENRGPLQNAPTAANDAAVISHLRLDRFHALVRTSARTRSRGNKL